MEALLQLAGIASECIYMCAIAQCFLIHGLLVAFANQSSKAEMST